MRQDDPGFSVYATIVKTFSNIKRNYSSGLYNSMDRARLILIGVKIWIPYAKS
jgi:hypothetical protein